MVAADVRRRISRPDRTASASSPGCAKTPKWHFGRTKKGFSDPSPPKKTRHIETVEVVFPGSPAGEEFSHSLVTRRISLATFRLVTSAATNSRLLLKNFARVGQVENRQIQSCAGVALLRC